MAKTGKQELGIAVSGAWAATLLDRSASTAPSTTSRRCCRRRPRPSSRSRTRAPRPRTPRPPRARAPGVDYYPSPPPPGVGGETGAFDAGARAMLEGLLKRRFAALPDLLRVCIPRFELARDDAGGGGGVAAFYEVCCATRGPGGAPQPDDDFRGWATPRRYSSSSARGS
ncbi:hypothetical protein JL721_11997 [Aureococcus anophagefferens]|nr:hypothetical protein JL721_11997 [Aureococcus anophagefferens]